MLVIHDAKRRLSNRAFLRLNFDKLSGPIGRLGLIRPAKGMKPMGLWPEKPKPVLGPVKRRLLETSIFEMIGSVL